MVGGLVRVALVVREEHLCSQCSGLIVAAEEGMRANDFVNEPDALKWLDCG
jgi:hypothetical protein